MLNVKRILPTFATVFLWLVYVSSWAKPAADSILRPQRVKPVKNRSTANALVDGYIAQKMKAMAIIGMAVAVVKDGKIIKMKGYGMANLEWQLPVTTRTAFQIASSSKLLTSTVIMKAVYDKKLSLTDPIEAYVDSIAPSWKGMQLKHLLNHTSGLKNVAADPNFTTAQVVRQLKDSSLAYPYGTNEGYASYDYALVRYILEKIYRKPYEQILKDVVTGPIGMTDGGFDMERKVGSWMQTRLISQKATTYYGPRGDRKAYKYIYPAYMYTAGGYFASIEDMAKWAVALDKETLVPRLIQESLTLERDSINHKPTSFSRAGWIVNVEKGTIRYTGHPGGPGLGDILRFPKEGYTFIVLSNDGELLPNMARAIASFYVEGLTDKPEVTKFNR